MSQLPDAFKGHDLTGWTLGLNDPETLTYFRRMTAIGPTIIRLRFTHNTSGFQWMPECEHLNQEVLHYAGFEFEEAIKIANEWASREQFGGWAHSPIGCSADSGWMPIEKYQIPTGPTYPAFLGGNSETGFVGECYWASVGQEFQHYGCPVELTHYKPHPAPPEVKQ